MAWAIIPEQGTAAGPCVKVCQHQDCEHLRTLAEVFCPYCDERLGYDRRIVLVGLEWAHFACVDTRNERQR